MSDVILLNDAKQTIVILAQTSEKYSLDIREIIGYGRGEIVKKARQESIIQIKNETNLDIKDISKIYSRDSISNYSFTS